MPGRNHPLFERVRRGGNGLQRPGHMASMRCPHGLHRNPGEVNRTLREVRFKIPPPKENGYRLASAKARENARLGPMRCWNAALAGLKRAHAVMNAPGAITENAPGGENASRALPEFVLGNLWVGELLATTPVNGKFRSMQRERGLLSGRTADDSVRIVRGSA